MQTAQRAELWEVILSLQALDAVHGGVDNLNVARRVSRLCDGLEVPRPVELDNDCDLLALVREMIHHRGGGYAADDQNQTACL